MIAAICFGALFGVPFIIWGLILIRDRDRTWQKKLQRGKDAVPPQRTRAWDMRQQFYGLLLILFGVIVLLSLSLFNYLAQGISPPSPM